LVSGSLLALLRSWLPLLPLLALLFGSFSSCPSEPRLCSYIRFSGLPFEKKVLNLSDLRIRIIYWLRATIREASYLFPF
jgi:hypothetical protein